MSASRASWSTVLVTVLIAGDALGCAPARTSPRPPEPSPEAPRGAGRSVASEGTGSVSVVDGDDLVGIPAAHPEQLLQGRVAGVQIIQLPGGGISVRIRGRGSFNGDTEPLYVVDGMLIQATAGRGLYWLSPGDIKRIEILKDAGTTSMYGVRGANGVVLVTTRRGKRSAQ
jgi:TonB-dependent SusC/RagA subfamily outer membrane receptor